MAHKSSCNAKCARTAGVSVASVLLIASVIECGERIPPRAEAARGEISPPSAAERQKGYWILQPSTLWVGVAEMRSDADKQPEMRRLAAFYKQDSDSTWKPLPALPGEGHQVLEGYASTSASVFVLYRACDDAFVPEDQARSCRATYMISSLNAVDEWTTPLVVPVDASLSGVTMRSLSNAVFVIDTSPSRPQMWRVDEAKAALQALGLVDPVLLAAAGQQGCATDAGLLLWGREYQTADGKVLNQSAAEGQLGTVGELPSQSGLRLQLVASDGTTTDLPSVNGFTVGSGQLGCAENGLVLLARRTNDERKPPAFGLLAIRSDGTAEFRDNLDSSVASDSIPLPFSIGGARSVPAVLSGETVYVLSPSSLQTICRFDSSKWVGFGFVDQGGVILSQRMNSNGQTARPLQRVDPNHCIVKGS